MQRFQKKGEESTTFLIFIFQKGRNLIRYLLCASHVNILPLIPIMPLPIGLALHKRKLRARDVNWLTQGYAPGKRQLGLQTLPSSPACHPGGLPIL